MNNKNILDKITDEDLREYLTEANKLISFDIEELMNVSKKYFKYFKDNSVENPLAKLQDRWYSQTDYTVYDDPYYLIELWLCWKIYSRRYIRDFKKINFLGDKNITSVVDLGCGMGYTTLGLKDLYPNASIYGTNYQESFQYVLAQNFGLDEISILPDVHSINDNIDLVFASEYFEHIERPVEHLVEIIDTVHPTYIITANSFNTDAIGHFKIFKHGNMQIPRDEISKIFAKTIKSYGYNQIKTKFWNNRPTVWKFQ